MADLKYYKSVSTLSQQLDYQRQSNSQYCDFHYQIPDADKHSFLSAHTCVLEACYGQKFVNFFELLKQSFNRTDFSQQNDFSIFQFNNKTIFKVPKSFQNIVEYCYTGTFHLKGEDTPNLNELQTLIEQLTEKPEIIVEMVTNLEKHEGNAILDKTEKTQTSKKRKKFTPTRLKGDEFTATASKTNKPKATRKKRKATPIKLVQKSISDQTNDNLNISCEEDDTSVLNSDNCSSSQNVDRSNSRHLIEGALPGTEKTVSSKDATDKVDDRSVICFVCRESFPTHSQLSKHFKTKHLDLMQNQSKAKRCEQSTCVFLKDKPKSKKKSKVKIPVGSCCGEQFLSKFRFGVHILKNHSITSVNCSECENVILLQDLIPHYQVCHEFPAFLQGQTNNDTELSDREDHRNFSNSAKENTINSVPLMLGAKTLPNENINESNDGHSIFNLDGAKCKKTKCLNDMWDKVVKCVGCLNEMSIRKYVDHLTEQYEHSQSDEINCNGFTLYRKYRCLYFQCLLCQNDKIETGMKPIRPYLLLKGHITNYHHADSTKDEKVRCDMCGNLILKHYIEEHKKRHAYSIQCRSIKVTCDICGKEVTKDRFTKHHRSHIERYACPHCSKVFNRKENLRVHERIHTGEKPFVCDVCGKGFRQKVELRLHGRRHEKEMHSQIQVQEFHGHRHEKETHSQIQVQESASHLNQNLYYF